MQNHRILSLVSIILSALFLVGALSVGRAWSCACGCGVFEVGTRSMLPTHPGSMAFIEADTMDQGRNWNGTSQASGADNEDKKILTNFLTVGYRRMFNRSWGFSVELPYWDRYFATTDVNGNDASFTHSSLGDARVKGVYSGFSPDMSSGLTVGLKLPTGDYKAENFDRDTQIGTGSTDVLLGAYRMGRLAALNEWAWFVNGQVAVPVLTAGGYTPGADINAVAGAYYDGLRLGVVRVAPLAQVIGSHRWRDSGVLAKSDDSGYDRVVIAPGIEIAAGSTRVYADVGFPVYQDMNGNQLVASQFWKLNIGYSF